MKKYILEKQGPEYYTRDNGFSKNLEDARLFKSIEKAATVRGSIEGECKIREVEVILKLGYLVKE